MKNFLSSAILSGAVIACSGNPGSNSRIEHPSSQHTLSSKPDNRHIEAIRAIDSATSAATEKCLGTLASVQGAEKKPDDDYPQKVRKYMIDNANPGCVPIKITEGLSGRLPMLMADNVTYPASPKSQVCQALDALKTDCYHQFNNPFQDNSPNAQRYFKTEGTLSAACDAIREENPINYSCIGSTPSNL